MGWKTEMKREWCWQCSGQGKIKNFDGSETTCPRCHGKGVIEDLVFTYEPDEQKPFNDPFKKPF